MTGDVDPFEFLLARDLGMTVDGLRRGMSQAEFVAWRAYYVYERAMTDLAARSG